jgi:pimeloyl-ACP methyl ester carboxylesterase
MLRLLGRLLVAVLATAAVSVVTAGLSFVMGTSPFVLAWTPSIAAVITFGSLMTFGWRSQTRRRQLTGVVLLAAVLTAGLAVSAWLSGWFSTPPAGTPAAALAADGYVATQDGAVFFHQTAPAGGERPVLLVLHGGPGSGSVGARAALEPLLAGSFRTVFLDQRGVGRSSPVSSFHVDDYLDDIERVRRALQIESMDIFGISWGAALAHEYAARHSDRVRAVVTWGGLVSAQETTRSMLAALERFYAAGGDSAAVDWCRALERQSEPYTRLQSVRVMNAINRSRLKTIRAADEESALVLAARRQAVAEWGYAPGETAGSLWATAATYMQSGLESYDVRPRLTGLAVPHLFLAGERDPLLSGVDFDALIRAMPRARVRRVADAGHTLDRPEAIVGEILAFVGDTAMVGAVGPRQASR